MTANAATTALVSQSVGLPSLFVVEDAAHFEDSAARAKGELEGFAEAGSAPEALERLSRGEKALYIERGEKLDPRVETLVTDYAAGLASFAAAGGGYAARRFNPLQAALAVVLSRQAAERSYPRLFEYAGGVASI